MQIDKSHFTVKRVCRVVPESSCTALNQHHPSASTDNCLSLSYTSQHELAHRFKPACVVSQLYKDCLRLADYIGTQVWDS